MAPFSKSLSAVQTKPKEGAGGRKSEENTFTMQAWIDEDWRVGVVPNGGYLLALVLQACSLVQQDTDQKEPLYLSAQYLGSSTTGPCTVTVERIKSGRNYCNMGATLSQHGKTNIHCQVIYGTLLPAGHPFGGFQSSPGFLTLAHPHALSRRCPLVTHPSKSTITPFRRPYSFAKHLIQAIDPYYNDLLQRRGTGQAPSNPVELGGGGSACGGWYQLLDEGDVITPQMLPLLGDVIPDLLPDSLAAQREPMWFPTLALSIDFKYRTLAADRPAGIAPRTVGFFFTTKFLIEGRYETTAEIWTAPCEIGNGTEEDGWQDKMYCMACVTQSALTVPASVNFKKTKANANQVSKL